MHQLVVEALAINRQCLLPFDVLRLLPFFTEHDDCLVICLVLEHLFNFCLFDGTMEAHVIDINLLLQLSQDAFDLRQELCKLSFALLAALLAPLVKVALLHLAVSSVRLDLQELEEPCSISALNDGLEALRKHRASEDEVLGQALAITLIATGSHLVAPLLQKLHCQEVFEERYLTDYHEIDSILNVFFLRDVVCHWVIFCTKLDETLL